MMLKEYMKKRKVSVNAGRQGNKFRGTVRDYLKPERELWDMAIALSMVLVILIIFACACFLHSGPKNVRRIVNPRKTSAAPGLFVFFMVPSALLLSWSNAHNAYNDYKEYTEMCDIQGLSGEMEDDFRSGRPLGYSMILGEKYLFVRYGCCAIPYGDITEAYYSAANGKYSSGMQIRFLQQWGSRSHVKIAEGAGWMKRDRYKWVELVVKIQEYNPDVAFDLDDLRMLHDDIEWDRTIRHLKEKAKNSIRD